MWSMAAQAGGDPAGGEATPLIIEGHATTLPVLGALGASGESVVVVVSGEGTQVYSFSDYQALAATGGQPAKAELAMPMAPPEPVAAPAPKPEPVTAPVTAPPTQLAAGAPDDGGALGGFLSEVRIGIMAHDVGVFGRSKEDGPDINAEILFVSPGFLEFIFAPRPHIGITANTGDDTSQIYAGLTWDWNFWDPFFIEGTLGIAVHDGDTDIESQEKKKLGCKALFRESVALGARFLEHHNISVTLAHISNAKLCEGNEGLDTVGVRYGYQF